MTKKILLTFFANCLLFASFSALAPPAANAQGKKDLRQARKLTNEGNRAFAQKNYRLAVDKYAQALVAAPNLAEAHFWKGYAHNYLQEYDAALAELNLAAENNFEKPLEIYKLRWSLNLQKRSMDAALDDVRKGLKLDPNNLAMNMALGEISRERKDYQTALTAYQKIAQANQATGDVYYFIAQSYQNLGNTQEQITNAAEAINRGTKYVGEAYFLKGDGYQKERKFDEALIAYQQSLASKDDPAAHRAMANIYRSKSRFNDAITTLRKLLRDSPQDGGIYTELSRYYSLADRHKEAIQAAQAAIRFLPEQSDAYTNLCRAYNDSEQYSLAVGSCNKALQLSPNDGETNFYLGRAYQKTDRKADADKYYPKAVTALEEEMTKKPEFYEGFYLLGNAYTSTANYDKAIEAYKKSLELSPRFTKARYNLGAIYKFQEKQELALEQYNALLELDKNLAAKLKDVIDKKN
jgi:tetratricopeptide (TPR) repeat protein